MRKSVDTQARHHGPPKGRLMEVDTYNFVSGFKTVHLDVATHNALPRLGAETRKTRARRSATEMRLCHVTTIFHIKTGSEMLRSPSPPVHWYDSERKPSARGRIAQS